MKRLIPIILLLALIVPVQVLAADDGRVPAVRVYFRTGVAALDTSFRGNGATLEAFCRDINAVLTDKGSILEAVLVETGASPEGGADLNDRLSMERARSVRTWLLANLPLNASQVKAYSVGADWEGVWFAVWESDSPYRQKILNAIVANDVRENHTAQAQAKCIRDLKEIERGQAWAWLSEKVFPDLRAGAGTIRCIISCPGDHGRDTVVVQHYYQGPDAEWYLDEASRLAAVAATATVLDATEKKAKGFRSDSLWRTPVVAFRSNLLMPLMNVGIEVPIGNRWSVAADLSSPWAWRPWTNRVFEPYQECYQAMAFSLEGRYWFGVSHSPKKAYGKYRLLGHSLALIAEGGYYDIEHKGTGMQGTFGAVGIDYMYAIPLGKKAGCHMEFDIAFGYMSTAWKGYIVPEGDTRLIGNYDDRAWHGPVPMRLGVRLVVPIFKSEEAR